MRIELTTPDGRHWEVDPDKIDVLEEAQPGMWAAGAKSVIHIGGEKQAVRETVEQIKTLEGKKS